MFLLFFRPLNPRNNTITKTCLVMALVAATVGRAVGQVPQGAAVPAVNPPPGWMAELPSI